MPRFYLNEFRPLAETSHGRIAIEKFSLPAFIDASCRREPDLESRYPSISALCRAEHFAPKLCVGDVVAYMTKSFGYPPKAKPTRRLVAVLRVKHSWLEHDNRRGLDAHARAAEWYQEQRIPAPSNCMISAKGRKPLEQTDRYFDDLDEWERTYRLRAMECGAFHACEILFCDVNDPPKFTNRQLVEWFGIIPNTRDLPALKPENFVKLLRWLAATRATTADILAPLVTELTTL
jgi:hypothetical protein